MGDIGGGESRHLDIDMNPVENPEIKSESIPVQPSEPAGVAGVGVEEVSVSETAETRD